MGLFETLFGVKYTPGRILQELPMCDSNGAVYQNIWKANIKGLTHNQDGTDPQKLVPKLEINEMVYLVPIPDNIHDDTAIKVKTDDGRSIGWYPSKDQYSEDLFWRLQAGEEVCASVCDKGIAKSSGKWWCEMKIVVYRQGSNIRDIFPEITPVVLSEITTEAERYYRVVLFTLESGRVAVSMLQRTFALSYSRAVRLVDLMEEYGIVGPFEGAKPRRVLITVEQYEQEREKYTPLGLDE